MTVEQKREAIVKLFAKAMFYGNWKWETPTERTITMLMNEIGLYPFDNEDQMIQATQVEDELYDRAKIEVKTN